MRKSSAPAIIHEWAWLTAAKPSPFKKNC